MTNSRWRIITVRNGHCFALLFLIPLFPKLSLLSVWIILLGLQYCLIKCDDGISMSISLFLPNMQHKFVLHLFSDEGYFKTSSGIKMLLNHIQLIIYFIYCILIWMINFLVWSCCCCYMHFSVCHIFVKDTFRNT